MTPLLIFSALAVGAPALKDPPPKTPPSIVGEWIPETVVIAGNKEDAPAGARIIIEQMGKLRLREGKDEKGIEFTYTIDTKRAPFHFDVSDPAQTGLSLPGIYKLEDETLTVCVSLDNKRPVDFVSPPKSSLLLITLKRVRKE